MSLFPRRTVQRALDALAPLLSVGEAKHLLNLEDFRAQLTQRRRLQNIGSDAGDDRANIWFELDGLDAALSPWGMASLEDGE
jgi:hypothetical protein